MSDIDQQRVLIHLKNRETKEAFFEKFTFPEAVRKLYLFDYEFYYDENGNKGKKWNNEYDISRAISNAKEQSVPTYSRHTLADFELYGGDINSLEYRFGYAPRADQKICVYPRKAVVGDFSIPKILDGMLVTAVAGFQDSWNLKTVTIPDSITEISSNAFKDCPHLASIALPDGLTRIGDFAFSGCGSLSRLIIPKSVTYIGNSAFADCKSLTEMIFPADLTHLGRLACVRCKSLKKISIPSGLDKTLDDLFFDR